MLSYLFWMAVSSFATLYFARPGFKKRVYYFFDWSDKPTTKEIGDRTLIVGQHDNEKKIVVDDWKRWDEDDEQR